LRKKEAEIIRLGEDKGSCQIRKEEEKTRILKRTPHPEGDHPPKGGKKRVKCRWRPT